MFLVTRSYAQIADPLSIVGNSSISATDSGYVLPFPGVLPDSPLYMLKTIRDRLVGLFISDPLKRSSFDLLQSDKRMNAVVFLQSQQKTDTKLMITTMSKALNYYEEGIEQLRMGRKIGENITDLRGSYLSASTKYEEIISDLGQQSTEVSVRDLGNNQKRLLLLEKQLRVIPKK